MNADKTTDFLNYRELAASAPETVTGQDLLPDKNVESAALAASLSAPPKSPAAGNSCDENAPLPDVQPPEKPAAGAASESSATSSDFSANDPLSSSSFPLKKPGLFARFKAKIAEMKQRRAAAKLQATPPPPDKRLDLNFPLVLPCWYQGSDVLPLAFCETEEGFRDIVLGKRYVKIGQPEVRVTPKTPAETAKLAGDYVTGAKAVEALFSALDAGAEIYALSRKMPQPAAARERCAALNFLKTYAVDYARVTTEALYFPAGHIALAVRPEVSAIRALSAQAATASAPEKQALVLSAQQKLGELAASGAFDGLTFTQKLYPAKRLAALFSGYLTAKEGTNVLLLTLPFSGGEPHTKMLITVEPAEGDGFTLSDHGDFAQYLDAAGVNPSAIQDKIDRICSDFGITYAENRLTAFCTTLENPVMATTMLASFIEGILTLRAAVILR